MCWYASFRCTDIQMSVVAGSSQRGAVGVRGLVDVDSLGNEELYHLEMTASSSGPKSGCSILIHATSRLTHCLPLTNSFSVERHSAHGRRIGSF